MQYKEIDADVKLDFVILQISLTNILSKFVEIYSARHKLSIASIVSLKNEGSFPVVNIFLFSLLEKI